MYLKCTSVFIILLFYFFTFFLIFMNGAVNLLNYSRVFTPYAVSIMGQTYKIITPNFDQFTTEYNAVANDNVLVLNETLLCKIDNKLTYYDFVRSESPHWNIYLMFGIITMSILLSYYSCYIDIEGYSDMQVLHGKDRIPSLRHNNLRQQSIQIRTINLRILPVVVRICLVCILLLIQLCIQ